MTSGIPSPISGAAWRSVIDSLAAAGINDYWRERLRTLTTSGIHLAIFVEPFLDHVLAGRKTVESRFASRRFAPYGRVCRGDVILLKRSSGPISGICEVTDVWFYRLDPISLGGIRTTFAEALCAQDPSFWHARTAASFATLMRITSVQPLTPFSYEKRDRRGWVVLKQAQQQQLEGWA